MFDEMTDSVLGGIFESGTGAHPNSQGDGLQIRHSLSNNPETIIKGCFAISDGILVI